MIVQTHAEEGDILWQFGSTTAGSSHIGSLKWTNPAIGTDGSVYVLADDLRLRAVDPDSPPSIKWVSGMDALGFSADPNWSPSVDASGTIWIGGFTSGNDFKLYAIDPADGSVDWSFAPGGNKEFIGAPAIDRNQIAYTALQDCIFAVAPDGSSYSDEWAYYNEENGNLKYRTSASIALSDDWVDSGVTNQFLFFPEVYLNGSVPIGGRVHALLATASSSEVDHEDSWTWDFPGSGEYPVNAPSIGADGTVYIGSSADKIYALDPYDSGNRVIWSVDLGSDMTSIVIGADHTLYIGGLDETLYALDPFDDGAEIWSEDVGGPIESTPVIGADGAIYVATTGGEFFA